jgi:cytochrome c oxidase assembly factor CtaG
MRTLTAILALFCLSDQALGHGSELHGNSATWTFDPWVVTPLALLFVFYLLGLGPLLRRAGRGRPAMLQRAMTFCAGMIVLTLALTSPLHWLGEHVFFYHMIEHELVMAVAAPLIVLARPVSSLLWGLPRRLRRSVGLGLNQTAIRAVWDWISRGTISTVLHGIAIWAWHMPILFEASIISGTVHRLQHLSFFASAVIFWWSVFRRSSHGVAAWHLFLTMLHTGLLGALMALAPRVLYSSQTAEALRWGLTPLEDQQLAGMLMWVPAGTVYAGAAIALTALCIKGSSKEITPHV